MTIYLYGLILSANAAGVPRSVMGLDGSAVRTVDAGSGALAAVVSDIARPPDRSSLDDVRKHDGVLRAVVEAGITVAASRFAQTFHDDDALRAAMRDTSERIARLLVSFDGTVEMRILLPGAIPDEPAIVREEGGGPGRAYLEELRARSAPVHVGLRSAIGPAVLAERVELLPDDRGVAFAHLVRGADVSEYRTAVEALPALAEARVVGPLALYSFAGPQDD